MPSLISATGLRLLKIETLLRSGEPLTATKWMALFDISLATMKRDLEMLRAESGAVLVFDRAEKTYVLKNPEWRGVRPMIYEEAAR